MNALTRTASTTLPRARATMQQRMQSTVPVQSFKKDWLSDPATYPVMAIVGIALTGCSGFASQKFARDGNVRVTSKAKGKVIRTW